MECTIYKIRVSSNFDHGQDITKAMKKRSAVALCIAK